MTSSTFEGGRVTIRVLHKHALERLLEDGRVERVGHDDGAAGPVDAALHLVEAHLIVAADEAVDHVRVGGCALGERLVVLCWGGGKHKKISSQGWVVVFFKYLGSLLHVLCIVLVNVVVRAQTLLEFVGGDHAGALGAGAAREEHDAGTRVGERALEQPDGDSKGRAGRAQCTLLGSDRPRVLLELLDNVREGKLALLHGHKEAENIDRWD